MINDDFDPDRQARRILGLRCLAIGYLSVLVVPILAWFLEPMVPALILFYPLPSLLWRWTDGVLSVIIGVLLLLQFPIYGIVLDFAVIRSRQAFRLALVWLFSLHMFAVVVCLRQSLLPWL